MQIKLTRTMLQFAEVLWGDCEEPHEPIKHKPINKKEDKWHE